MSLAKLDDAGKLVLRVVLGVLILFHGVAKLAGGVGGIGEALQGMGLPGFLAYGVYLGEVVGPILLILGWYSRVGAALIVVNMLFALLIAHMGELFMLKQTGGWQLELQGMFLFSALALALTGPGRLSFNRQ